MTDEEVKQHNDRVSHLPVWLKSGHMPTIIPRAFAEKMIAMGVWKQYEDIVYINQWLKGGKPGPEETTQ